MNIVYRTVPCGMYNRTHVYRSGSNNYSRNNRTNNKCTLLSKLDNTLLCLPRYILDTVCCYSQPGKEDAAGATLVTNSKNKDNAETSCKRR